MRNIGDIEMYIPKTLILVALLLLQAGSALGQASDEGDKEEATTGSDRAPGDTDDEEGTPAEESDKREIEALRISRSTLAASVKSSSRSSSTGAPSSHNGACFRGAPVETCSRGDERAG